MINWERHEAKLKYAGQDKMVFISAKNHLHTEVLKERMVDAVLQGQVHTENTIITNARHYHALKEVEKSLTDIRNGLNNNLPGDLLALDIRRCLHYLGEITGEITNEDQLDYIFSVNSVSESNHPSFVCKCWLIGGEGYQRIIQFAGQSLLFIQTLTYSL